MKVSIDKFEDDSFIHSFIITFHKSIKCHMLDTEHVNRNMYTLSTNILRK
jgi:hypothetical protein